MGLYRELYIIKAAEDICVKFGVVRIHQGYETLVGSVVDDVEIKKAFRLVLCAQLHCLGCARFVRWSKRGSVHELARRHSCFLGGKRQHRLKFEWGSD